MYHIISYHIYIRNIYIRNIYIRSSYIYMHKLNNMILYTYDRVYINIYEVYIYAEDVIPNLHLRF